MVTNSPLIVFNSRRRELIEVLLLSDGYVKVNYIEERRSCGHVTGVF